MFDEIQDADFLWIIMIGYMAHLIGWLQPYLSLLVDPSYWMAAPMPWIPVIVHSIMDGCAHATYHVSQILVAFLLVGFLTVVFGVNAFS